VPCVPHTVGSIIEHSQPKGINTKLRGYEVRSSVNLQGAFNQKGVKANECKQELLVFEELCRKK